jgi:F-type H+-transporting ATPase subunit a
MLIASGFSWFHLFPGVEDGTLFPVAHDHGFVVLGAWFACLLAILFALAARSGLNAAMSRDGLGRYHADEKLSAFVVAEMFISAFMGIMSDVMDQKYVRAFLPLVMGLFFYILTCNLLAIIPGFQPPTDNINTNAGMAVVVALTYLAVGLGVDAKSFVGHMMGPIWWLAPLILFIEGLGLLAIRPLSLGLRLTGNIFGDHTVFNIMSSLTYVVVPSVFLALAILVSLIQAGVFALLTSIYISTSLPHGHDDHH